MRLSTILNCLLLWTLALGTTHASIHVSAQPKTPVFATVLHVPAKNYLLAESETGQVLAEQNAQIKASPASLTKLMSLYVVFQALDQDVISMNDQVLISKKSWKTGGSKMFLREGTRVPVSELIKGVIVLSGNDATVALAEHLAGNESEFVTMMNLSAKNLGMTHSHFTNATGLSSKDHYVTAEDMGTLASALINHFPKYYPLFSIKDMSYNNIHQNNRNHLLWLDEHVDGLKTGHTSDAGYCLVSSGKKNNARLIAVVLGAQSQKLRDQASAQLLHYGFNHYHLWKLYPANSTITKRRVYFGNTSIIKLISHQPVHLMLPNNIKTEAITKHIDLQLPIKAPLNTITPLGKLTLTYEDHTLLSIPLFAQNKIQQGNWLKKTWDHALLWLHQYGV